MTADCDFAKWPLGLIPLEQTLRLLDVHPLDHLVFEPLGAALKCVNQAPGALEFRLRWSERLVARLDLARMDQALAVETEPPPFFRLGDETVEVVELVVHAVEDRDPGCPRRQNDEL